MKFDFCIGNPPYQDNTTGENETYSPPVYDRFMDASFSVADRIELIHPARFLFNAGSTPKAWNEKMLNDSHLKVLEYHEDATDVFANTDIKGGIVITYYDKTREFHPIEIFTKYVELNSILEKIITQNKNGWIGQIVYIQNRFVLSVLLSDYPNYKSSIGSDGKDSRFEKNIFEKIPLFMETPFSDSVRTIGIFNGKRTWRYIDIKYVDDKHENLTFYKVVIPVANGSGEFGQALSTPIIEKPNEAYTRSFIGIGAFKTESEAANCCKYIKTKFTRTMLHILKVTQMANKDVWRYVPLQDFTDKSDIDWMKTVHEIDLQLYKKYGLSDDEIKFIETHVKEME